MLTVGAYLYTWCDKRYLPLVLEELSLFDHNIALCMDRPFNWRSERPCPSGKASGVREVLSMFPFVHVEEIERVIADTPSAANNAAENYCSHWLKDQGVDVAFILSADHIIDLDELRKMIDIVRHADEPCCYNMAARHFWRDWEHIYADTGLMIARPTALDVFVPNDAHFETLPGLCFHPSWILSDEEAYRKVHSWGHADIFTARNFYENEWLGRNDANWNARPLDIELPPWLAQRLTKWNAWLQ